ncbi:MAG: FlgD immunoglobulin-like domain containing protein, partial [Bacteroidota bacterium]
SKDAFVTETISSSNNTYTFDITAGKVDEIGIRYFFEVVGISVFNDTSSTGHTYIQYPNGRDVSSLDFGPRVFDYNIISVPLELENSAISAVVEDDFGAYNVRQWRFFHYDGQTTEYQDGLTDISIGKGYWLITKTDRLFNTGPGNTAQVTEENPFQISLQPGWNQLGNPYGFDLDWEEVKNANANLGDLVVFVDGFRAASAFSDLLPAFRGGFVFADQAGTIDIPVDAFPKRKATPSGPIAIGPIDQARWEVPLSVESDGLRYPLAGIGMRPDADESKDQYDQMGLPRLNEYLDITFTHEDYFYPWFRKDIVPSTKEYIWEFTVESNLKDEEIYLEWDNSEFGNTGKKLILFDVERQLAIDMADQQTYLSLSASSVRPFRIYYGWQSFIDEAIQPDQVMLGSAFPNPFSESVSLPFTLPNTQASYHVRMSIRNLLGQEVKRLYDDEKQAGFNQIEWRGDGENGRRLAAGMYLYHLEVWIGDKVWRDHGKVQLMD